MLSHTVCTRSKNGWANTDPESKQGNVQANGSAPAARGREAALQGEHGAAVQAEFGSGQGGGTGSAAFSARSSAAQVPRGGEMAVVEIWGRCEASPELQVCPAAPQHCVASFCSQSICMGLLQSQGNATAPLAAAVQGRCLPLAAAQMLGEAIQAQPHHREPPWLSRHREVNADGKL